MKKKIRIITIGIIVVSFFITLNFLPKSKVNRKVREKFKAEFFTEQSNMDFTNIELENNISSFFDIDILEVSTNMVYFDDDVLDFDEELEDSLYDYEDINEDIIDDMEDLWTI